MNNRFDLLLDTYIDRHLGVDTGFLSTSLSQGLLQNIIQLQLDEKMAKAGIGNHAVMDKQQTMRGDQIYWMDKSHENIFEQEFLLQMDDFITYLNKTCYTGINGYEFHYTVYENGTSYKRHFDQFKNDSKRKFSMISYLNTDWLEADGGQLWVYGDEGIQKILPEANTTVFFKSDEMEHEVTEVHRDRMSVTGWLKQV